MLNNVNQHRSSINLLSIEEENLLSNFQQITHPDANKIVPSIYFSPCIYDLSKQGRHSWCPEKIRICYINGINTSFNEARGTVSQLSELAGGLNIYGVYNPSFSFIGDLCISLSLLIRTKTKTQQCIKELWDDFFSSSDKDGLLLQICSNQGAIFVRNALEEYNPEFRKRICVLALAPAVHINPNLCCQITSLQTFFDPIPKLDLIGLCRFNKTIKFLNPHKEVFSLIDSPNSSSFFRYIQKSLLNFFIITKCLDINKIAFFTDDINKHTILRYQQSLIHNNSKSYFTLDLVKISGNSETSFGPEIINQWEHFKYKLSKNHIGRLEVLSECLEKISKITMFAYVLINCSSSFSTIMTLLTSISVLDLFSFIALQVSRRHQYNIPIDRKIILLTKKICSIFNLPLNIFLLIDPSFQYSFIPTSSRNAFLTAKITSELINQSFFIFPPTKTLFLKIISSHYTGKNNQEELNEPLLVNLDAKLFVKSEKIKEVISEIILTGTTCLGCIIMLVSVNDQTNTIQNYNNSSFENDVNFSPCLELTSRGGVFPYVSLTAYTSILMALTATKITRLTRFFLKKSKKIFS